MAPSQGRHHIDPDLLQKAVKQPGDPRLLTIPFSPWNQMPVGMKHRLPRRLP